MSLIKQGKTNYKFISVVITLVAAAALGIFFYTKRLLKAMNAGSRLILPIPLDEVTFVELRPTDREA